MALQTIAGKFYNVKFSKISQSSTIEGETFFDVRKHTSQIPHRFLRGKSSVEKGGFFDAKLITSADHLKIIKLDNQFNYLGLRFDLFKTMMNSFIVSQSSSPSASVNMSSSFFAPGKFGSLLSDSDYITLIEEDRSEGTVSPRYILRSSGSDNQSSGIVNSSGYLDITIHNSSSFNTHASWSFSPGGGDNVIVQTGHTSSFTHRFFHTESNLNGIALSGSQSGSVTGVGTNQFVNNSNSTDGRYAQFLLKAKIFGDGNYNEGEVDSSDFSSPPSVVFLPTREIIVYKKGIAIRSGSFKYNASSSEAASSSGATTTLFYQSGSNGPSGSFTGSNINQGSHIYLNANFTTPASSGYYAEPGTHNVLHAFRGGLTSDVTSSAVAGGIEFQVPRFVSRSVGPF
tara:strand:- start:569 stop:1765 length:1197 start_codon:yes stop_codon:yes gene_type:complete